MAPDIEAKLANAFPAAQVEEARAILSTVQTELEVTSRILRCVIVLAGGDIALMNHFADCARHDWRDVIYWAEYDQHDRQIRDFNEPFVSEAN
jgi:hypothetical protein